MAVGYDDDEAATSTMFDNGLPELNEAGFVQVYIRLIQQPYGLSGVKMCGEKQALLLSF